MAGCCACTATSCRRERTACSEQLGGEGQVALGCSWAAACGGRRPCPWNAWACNLQLDRCKGGGAPAPASCMGMQVAPAICKSCPDAGRGPWQGPGAVQEGCRCRAHWGHGGGQGGLVVRWMRSGRHSWHHSCAGQAKDRGNEGRVGSAGKKTQSPHAFRLCTPRPARRLLPALTSPRNGTPALRTC